MSLLHNKDKRVESMKVTSIPSGQKCGFHKLTEHDVMDVYGSASLTAWTVVNIMQGEECHKSKNYTQGR